MEKTRSPPSLKYSSSAKDIFEADKERNRIVKKIKIIFFK
jgi:hypothetical protein